VALLKLPAHPASIVAVAASAILSGCAAPAGQSPCAPTTTAASRGFAAVDQLLRDCAESGAFPGGVLFVGGIDTIFHSVAFGHYGDNDRRPVSDSTVYDLASLTKVVGLTTAVMLLVADDSLDLDQTLADFFPQMARTPKGDVTVRQLLTHTSGLAAWRPLHLETASKQEALDSVLAAGLETAPGTTYRYSDLGAITLGLVVERVSGHRLDEFLHDRVFSPLGMEWTTYRPPQNWLDRIAPTENDPWRGRVLRGEVHDENAARLEGVAGHAGLFSMAPDLARFAQWMLRAYHGGAEPATGILIDSQIVRVFVTRQPGPPGSTRALGWDTPSDEGSSAGTLLSRSSFGHTGFTGTSIWIDPELNRFVILLTKRVHPTRENNAIGWIRGQVADMVVRALSEPPTVR
jgi:CubicO group peptidase (beta-lactamase class C family)